VEQPQRDGFASHTIYPFNDDHGRLAGALTPMEHSFDTTGQWQAYLDTIIAALIASDPDENLNGIYSVTFMSNLNGNALVLTRHSHEASAQVADIKYPADTLALMHISYDEEWGLRLGLLAIRGGYFPGTGSIRKDKVVATVVDSAGTVCSHQLTKDSKLMAKLMGKAMLAVLDEQLSDTIPNEWNR
jgi:hypothetical protein